MEFAIRLWPLVLVLGACAEPAERVRAPHAKPEIFGAHKPYSEGLSSIRDSADAAFAALDRVHAHAETRVGPQSWPEDLPKRWPVLPRAIVMVESRRSTGDRLLLLNVPGSPDRAVAAYRSVLRAHGYSVERPRQRRNLLALRARSAEHEAVLTFFARERATRR